MTDNYEIARPNAASLIQSLRAFGYDIATAIADLVDNSITAGAKRVDIIFEWNHGKPWIAILDDGRGMSENVLRKAMIPGCKSPLEERNKDDLGRFGLGLKTASFSQCKRMSVMTKEKTSGQVNFRCWDLDIVEREQEWVLIKEYDGTACKFVDTLSAMQSGTAVLWEKIDRIIPEGSESEEAYQRAFLDYAGKVKKHIATVYSSFMKGKNKVSFYINDREIQLWDPFMTSNPATTIMPEETLYVNDEKVVIQPYILPHYSKLTQQEFEEGAGNRGWNDQQGFYIFRNNRLLVAGEWLIDDMQKKEQYRLARIRIDIGNNMDCEWNIDVRKSMAVPPISIHKEIRRIAVAAQRESTRIYRHRGKRISRESKGEQSYVWKQHVRRGKLGYEINREHVLIKQMLQGPQKDQVKLLLEMIEETVPVPLIISDYSDKSDEMIKPYEGIEEKKIQDTIEKTYKLFLECGYSQEEAINKMAACEPFIYCPEEVQVFKERKLNIYE